MPGTLVVLSAHRPDILPVAAVSAVRAAGVVVADDTVPPEIAAALGARRMDTSAECARDGVLFTTDAAHPARVRAATVIEAPVGTAVLDAVAVMDRLRSSGGCPWDAEQTHRSLLQYLVEECYELYQAIEDGDRTEMREELGDVLLQVLFHARIAAEPADRAGQAGDSQQGMGSEPDSGPVRESEPAPEPASFGIDEVAADLVAKLVGRHPHVFPVSGAAEAERVDTAERQEHRWEELKRSEKERDSSVDGVPLGQPAVALAAKLVSRAARAGLPAELLPDGPDIGQQLFGLAARAKLAGVDPEAQLRTAARRFADDVRAAESAARSDGHDPHALDAPTWRRYWPR